MDPPLIGERHREIFFCPVRDGEIVSGHTDYRGPAVPLTRIEADEPIGADREDNHGGDGINVLLKDGSVHWVSRDDALWHSCRSLLSP